MLEMFQETMFFNVLNVSAVKILKKIIKSNHIYIRYACVLAFDVKILPEA